MLNFRSITVPLLLVTLVIASAVASWLYDSTPFWLSDLAYGAIDENWKLLLGVWIGLSGRPYAWRVLFFVAGVGLVWALVNLWPIVTLRLLDYVDSPIEIVRSMWLTAWPALAVAVSLATVQYRYRLFLYARNVPLPHQGSAQFSLRQLLWSFVVAAIVLSSLKLIESRLDMTSHIAFLLSDFFKGARLAVIGCVAAWAMLSARLSPVGVVAVLVISLCTALLMAHSFQRWDALQQWLLYAMMQFGLCVVSMLALRVAGYRLWHVPPNTNI